MYSFGSRMASCSDGAWLNPGALVALTEEGGVVDSRTMYIIMIRSHSLRGMCASEDASTCQ